RENLLGTQNPIHFWFATLGGTNIFRLDFKLKSITWTGSIDKFFWENTKLVKERIFLKILVLFRYLGPQKPVEFGEQTLTFLEKETHQQPSVSYPPGMLNSLKSKILS
ncbi:hypothetical protein ACJX0J_041834, partial [Zea mays]